MKRAWFVAIFIAGCAVSVGNPGEPRGKLAKLSGIVVNLEDQRPLQTAIRLEAAEQRFQAAATSAPDGTYQFADLAEGLYHVHIGASFTYQIPVSENTRFDVFLPTPAAPTNFQVLDLDDGTLCFLWEDRSGLEAGFILQGDAPAEIPANHDGVVLAHGLTERFVLWAYNEYGESVTVTTQLELDGEDDMAWRDRERCTVPPDADLPVFLEFP